MQLHKLDTHTQVFFYEQDFYVLSNFAAFNLGWKGLVFHTSEAAYQWEKFPHLPKVQEWIYEAPSAHKAYKIAQEWKQLQRPNWNKIKIEIMRLILWDKVSQHDYVYTKLLATGNRELIEDSWRDDFWGWGANKNGKNMLGKLWMEIRHELEKEKNEY